MCGIIGYFGDKNPKDVIVDGLKRLEYRGYDSAGVAILNDGQLKRLRAEGKLKNLEKKLEGETFSGNIGIGHTRWATHGVPSERNAHPHVSSDVSIVHNGIIENYQDIRDELVKDGVVLSSETDSELIAHLISRALGETKDLFKAVEKILPVLQGAFSIVALWEQQPDTMVAFKDGPPLLLGASETETIIASDLQAIISYTNKVIFLEDQEIALVRGTDFQIFKRGKNLQRELVEVEWTAEAAEKQGYPHFMLKEIYEQPRAVASAMEPHVNLKEMSIQITGLGIVEPSEESTSTEQKKFEEIFSKVERIFIVACGTSYYAGMYGEYLIEQLAGIPVEIEFASEFRYRKPVIPKNSLVISISQSGETADTLASVRMAKSLGAKVLSICNVKTSSIDREANYHMYLRAEAEIGVASTKAFTCTMMLLNLLAGAFAKIKDNLNREEEQEYIRALQSVPSDMEKVFAYDKFFAESAEELKRFKGFLYLGRGLSFPIALEGALKLKELAYMHAEGYAAGEMKHGPIALIDDDMAVVVVAPKDEVFEKTISNLEEVRARGGQIITVSNGHDKKLEEISLEYLALPEGDWRTNSMVSVIPVQLMAYHVANSLGHDVDQPRNLAKSVTVE
ncbi:MAG: glutamine--fructose-6-phosphate transaminase (isomerizing) [Bdellovibrionales bacterium]